jgi:hypothetical protein
MKAELRTITPDWARKVLNDKNVGNRAMNPKHVAVLSNEIKSGRWKVNGDTICINDDRLIDGQHRLAAIVHSNIAVQSFVIEGLPSDVFDTKDVGKRRSPGDTLGVLGEKNSYRMASALALVDKYMTGRADKTVDYTNTAIEELLAKYPDIRESLQVSASSKGIMPPSVLDACYYIFSQKDKLLAVSFVNKVVRGIGLEAGDPFHMLRERMLKNSISKAKLTKHYVMALCIKAWNSARNGMKVRTLRWRETGDATEAFPVAL